MRSISLLVLLFSLLSGSLSAQDFDQRLLEAYSLEELKTMEQNNPQELILMEKFAHNGFLVMDYPKEKKGALDPSTALKISDLTEFNPLAFSLKPHDHARIYYPIVGEPGKMIAILPRTELAKLSIEKSK